MTFDWTLTLGAIINAVAMLAAVCAFLVTRIRRDTILDFRLSHIENTAIKQADEMEKISDTLAKMSTQEVRLLHLEEDVRLLRTSEAFIPPLRPGRKDF
jgi:hypothetical protein